jgi:hypothetical protein
MRNTSASIFANMFLSTTHPEFAHWHVSRLKSHLDADINLNHKHGKAYRWTR